MPWYLQTGKKTDCIGTSGRWMVYSNFTSTSMIEKLFLLCLFDKTQKFLTLSVHRVRPHPGVVFSSQIIFLIHAICTRLLFKTAFQGFYFRVFYMVWEQQDFFGDRDTASKGTRKIPFISMQQLLNIIFLIVILLNALCFALCILFQNLFPCIAIYTIFMVLW